MSAALASHNRDQTPFLASNVDLADAGSPMQQDEDSLLVKGTREQELAEIPVPTPDELAKAVSDSMLFPIDAHSHRIVPSF
jgi:hypothetical protein